MENETPNKEQTGGLKLMTVFIIVLALHIIVIGAITVYHSFPKGETKEATTAAKNDASTAKATDELANNTSPTAGSTDELTGVKSGPATPGDSNKAPDVSNDPEPAALAAKATGQAPSAPEAVTPNTVVDAKNAPATTTDATTLAPEAAAASASQSVATGTYTVKSGDTLSKVAHRNAMTVAELKKMNNLKSSKLRIGQVLKIKGGTAAETMVAAAPAQVAPVATAAPVKTSVATTALAVGNSSTYKVNAGDTLTKIARKFNTTAASIMAANKIVDANKLKVGMSLVIPQKAAKSSVSENVAPEPPTKTASNSPELVMNK